MNRIIREKLQLWLAATVFGFSISVAAPAPDQVIAEAVNLLDKELSARRDELASDKDALYALIDEILLPRFDRRGAAQQVLAKHWKTATDEQKDRFVDAFYTVLLHSYADGVLQFDASRINILKFSGDLSKRVTMVKTIVLLDDGTKVPVNYRLVNREQEWLIFDVSIEGISYVRNYRAEIGAEILRSSLDAVIERLEAQVAEPAAA